MTTQLGNRISLFERNGFDGRENLLVETRRPPILVGIQRDVCPPLTFGQARLERMRIIVFAPEHAARRSYPDLDDFAEGGRVEVLPLLPTALPRERAPQFRPRQVLGEILRGENGALYERFGNHIRPLRRLVSGPSGEVLEIAAHVEATPPLRARVPAPPVTEAAREADAGNRQNATVPPGSASPLPGVGAKVKDESRGEPGKTPSGFRPLLPEPGLWRVVRLGDFKAMLAPQLAHPERLRYVHRLPCYVQVFEVTTPQRIEALAEALFEDAGATSQLRPLTPAIVHQLQLAPLLPAPACLSRPATRRAGLLLPADRVLCLEVANDPTDEPQPAASNGEPPRPSPAPAEGQGEGPESWADPAALSPASAPAAAVPSVLKTTIPPPFLKPWEFRFTREEVLFDLFRARSFFGRLRAGLRRLTGGLLFNSEFRKWQVMLTGKNLEEQLWSVRPPKRALDHPFIREWTERTLESAGYDARLMLPEWEIYWRRKGV